MNPETLHIHNAHGSMGHSLRDYFPLLGMMSVVLALTLLSVNLSSLDAMTAFMGWFFLVFGSLKIIRLHAFVQAYKMYDVIAKQSTAYAYLYPFLELGAGLAYLLAWNITLVSAIALPILLISAYGVYLKVKQNEAVPCACLGTVFKVPMTWVTLGEDLLMALMALMMLFM